MKLSDGKGLGAFFLIKNPGLKIPVLLVESKGQCVYTPGFFSAPLKNLKANLEKVKESFAQKLKDILKKTQGNLEKLVFR